jgi:HEAT repeat protein
VRQADFHAAKAMLPLDYEVLARIFGLTCGLYHNLSLVAIGRSIPRRENAMNKANSIGGKLAALNALRENLEAPDTVKLLRESLADHSNLVVSRAAEIIGESKNESFVDDLVHAFQRLMSDPVKMDPGCVGKTAIVRALVVLGREDGELYRHGVEYKQPEPKWGGSKDTAGELRGVCAAGLVLCATSIEVLNACAQLLEDACAEARMGAARAIGALRQPEGGPLLRLKLFVGDANAEVVGECCAALLRLDRESGVEFVVQFLSSENADVSVQAALALGESRLPNTFEPLRKAWEREREPAVRESFLICIGLLRTAEVRDFLLSLIETNRLGGASDAIKALKAFGNVGDLKHRIEKAVNATGDPRLVKLFQREWPN